MSLTFSPPPLSRSSSSLPHALHTPPLLPMSILRRLTPRHLSLHINRNNRRRVASVAAAVRQDTTVWSQAPLSQIEPAAESLFHVTIDVSDFPDLATSHTRPGQYLQLRIPDVEKPSFLAIASPPSYAVEKGAFEFLVKSVAGSTAELLCGLKKGDVVELSQVMGKGFQLDRISPPEKYPTVLIFATGSGIRYQLHIFCVSNTIEIERIWNKVLTKVGFRGANLLRIWWVWIWHLKSRALLWS